VSRNAPGVGHSAYESSDGRDRAPRTVHLRVGAGTSFPGPACGIDNRPRNQLARTGGMELTDDPTMVTCGHCQRSHTFKTASRRKEAEET
jgi:hypothetical protein